MKKKSTSKSAFFNVRVLIAAIFCVIGVSVALFGTGLFGQTKNAKNSRSSGAQEAPGTQTPDVVHMVGPIRLNQDLRTLPYVAPKTEFEERPLTRYPHGTGQAGDAADYGISGLAKVEALLKNLWRPTPAIPPPLLTFDGINLAQSACSCFPPDTNGDVGPNHYVQAVNTSFRVFDRNGNPLAGPVTFSSFFASLTGTACSGGNQIDPIVFYDQIADRWVVSDLANVSFPGTSFWECIGVSQSPDPVAGPWVLYAIQTDPANPQYMGDYPKFALWPNPQPGGAYHFTANLFSNPTTFNGVRVYALDRASMLAGGPANAIAFTIPPAALGDSYRLVPAGFRTGDPPPAARDEMLLAIDSPANGGVVQTHVHGWLFHVDFVNPGNSTIGIAPNHSPNAEITVNSFVDAFTTDIQPCATAGNARPSWTLWATAS